MATHLRTDLVLDALNMAAWQRRPEGVIHHSDQGSQYTSLAFGKRCQETDIRTSMGSVGDAYDNALCESFFGTLECELIERRTFRTVQAEHNRACKAAGIPDYTIHDHRHTAAVHLARAEMPLHLLQQQFGHQNIETTMKYSRFHPDYSDVAGYFERVGSRLGLTPERPEAAGERTQKAAELLGVDPEALAVIASEIGAAAKNRTNNTPSGMKPEEARSQSL